MQDDLNGRQPHWKTTSMEDDYIGGQPQWKMTTIEDDLNLRCPQYILMSNMTRFECQI